MSIRQNSNLKGISIGKEETKLLQYANDTTAVLADEYQPCAVVQTCYYNVSLCYYVIFFFFPVFFFIVIILN